VTVPDVLDASISKGLKNHRYLAVIGLLVEFTIVTS